MTPRATRAHRPLLEAADVPLVVAIAAVGLIFRLLNFSGLGLGDDMLLRFDIYSLVHDGQVRASPNAYRFTWWLPTAVACRVFGLTERGFIVPILVFDVLGIITVYLLATNLWGRAAAVAAALLLVVLPLDVAWSTMLTMDIVLSVFSALCILAVLRATDRDGAPPRERARAWTVAGLCLWLAYHTKISALLLVPALGAIAWIRRRALDRTVLYFVATTIGLFSATVLGSWILAGDALAPYHTELTWQGLTGDDAVRSHRFTSEFLWTYPRWLFCPDVFGDLVHSIYPHLLVGLAVAAPVLGLPTAWEVVWWLVMVLLGLEFNVQRVQGAWVAGFRSVRYTHVFAYPIVLLLGSYLAALRVRSRRGGTLLLALLLAFSAWESVSTASKTRIAFGDLRTVCSFLAGLPAKPVHSDFQLGYWMSHAGLREHGWDFAEVAYTPAARVVELARLAPRGPAYVVTGGGREPYYGCTECVPKAAELDLKQWALVKEFPSPIGPTSWRPEPLRLWEVRPSP